jgi:beta-glucosidase
MSNDEAKKYRFPDGFLWGTAEEAYQHEGFSYNNDWYEWERKDPSPIARNETVGKGVDFYHRWEEDFRRAAAGGENAHRIGLEWSRIEPEPGRYDEGEISRYRAMLESMRSKGFTVFLNLWHFTLPLWAYRSGGWADPRLMDRWKQYVRLCAERFGDLVDYWSTMIDSQIHALNGYLAGAMPPGRSEPAVAGRVYRSLVLAHAEAYHLLKEQLGNSARVGQIYFFFVLFPRRRNGVDALLCRLLDGIFNWNYLDALHSGRLKLHIPAAVRIKEDIPRAAGTLDWLGINYFTRKDVAFSRSAPGFIAQLDRTGVPKSDMGWEIYPEGLTLLGRRLADRYPGLPLHITECGLADADDSRRPRFIIEHLRKAHQLIKEGVPIKSFFYWSSMDNWEWNEGWAPKFGLYEVAPGSLERIPRPSAALFSFIARHNRLPGESELARIFPGGLPDADL